MPWRVTTVQEIRRSFCERVLAGESSMSSLCREFGISRRTGYKWLGRYKRGGLKGLSDRSRRPRQSPGRSSAALEALVVSFKQQYPYWGPRKLRQLVYRSHPEIERVSVSTFARILNRHGLVIHREEPVVYPQVDRFERTEPNELWQMDLKMAVRQADGTKRYVAGILDDHSRFALGLWWLEDLSDSEVLSCWIDAARTYGLPEATLTDHGAQFRMQDHATSAFRVYLWACGVQHTQGRVRHPQTQGKIERFWETMQDELTPYLERTDPTRWPMQLDIWRRRYNIRRPHESLDDRTPASRYRPSRRAFVPPDRQARIGREGSVYRRVSPNGQIALGGRRVMIGRGLANWTVELRPLGNGCWHAYFRDHFLREFVLTENQKVLPMSRNKVLPMSRV